MGGGYLGFNGWEGKKKRGLRENIKQEQEAKTVGLLYGFGRGRFYICVHISGNISLSTNKIAPKNNVFSHKFEFNFYASTAGFNPFLGVIEKKMRRWVIRLYGCAARGRVGEIYKLGQLKEAC